MNPLFSTSTSGSVSIHIAPSKSLQKIETLIAAENKRAGSTSQELNELLCQMRMASLSFDEKDKPNLYPALIGLSQFASNLENVDLKEKALDFLLEATEALRGNLDRGVSGATKLLECLDILVQSWNDTSKIQQSNLDTQVKIINVIGEVADLVLRYSYYQRCASVSAAGEELKTKFKNLIEKFEQFYSIGFLDERPDFVIALEYAKTSINILRSTLHIPIAKLLNELYEEVNKNEFRLRNHELIMAELIEMFKKFGKGALSFWFLKAFFLKGLSAVSLQKSLLIKNRYSNKKESCEYLYCYRIDSKLHLNQTWQVTVIGIQILAKTILNTKKNTIMDMAFKRLKFIIDQHQSTDCKNEYIKKILTERLWHISENLVECGENSKQNDLSSPEKKPRSTARELIVKLYQDSHLHSPLNQFLLSHFKKIGMIKEENSQPIFDEEKFGRWLNLKHESGPRTINPLSSLLATLMTPHNAELPIGNNNLTKTSITKTSLAVK